MADGAPVGPAGGATTPPRAGQARSLERREQLLTAALRLLLSGGVAAVTHRGVAEEACSSPGAVRYHFRTREDLLAACVEDIERARAGEAERIVDLAVRGGPCEVEDLAWMLLRAYYGPSIQDATVTGTFWSILDCGRESPRLSRLLGEYRQVATGQLERILSAGGYQELKPSLAAAVLDGGILTATMEGVSPVTQSAVTDLAAVLRMARS